MDLGDRLRPFRLDGLRDHSSAPKRRRQKRRRHLSSISQLSHATPLLRILGVFRCRLPPGEESFSFEHARQTSLTHSLGQNYNSFNSTNPSNLNTLSFRFFWTLCVASVSCAGGYIGSTATILQKQWEQTGETVFFHSMQFPSVSFWRFYLGCWRNNSNGDFSLDT